MPPSTTATATYSYSAVIGKLCPVIIVKISYL